MKKRYLKIYSEIVWATDKITRSDLAQLKNKQYDLILDLEKWKMFDTEQNAWVEITGD